MQEVLDVCSPIVTKPKPKVELPKEDKAEQNGPANEQQAPAGEAQTGSPQKGGTAQPGPEPTESKPEMDLD